MVAKDRERLAVNKQTTHRLYMERFNLKKLNEVELSNRFAALENLDAVVDIKLLDTESEFQRKGV
jgi:tyrosyl-tRNA synthetase